MFTLIIYLQLPEESKGNKNKNKNIHAFAFAYIIKKGIISLPFSHLNSVILDIYIGQEVLPVW
jgi:hypothetical protein